MNNFEVHAQYLAQVFNQFSEQDTIVQKIEEEKPIEFVVPSFLDIQQVWDDAQGTLRNNKFYAMAFIGTQGTGKTQACEEVTKLAQKAGYRIIYAMPEDYLEHLEEWLNTLAQNPRALNCLILDDQSYAAGTKSNRVQAAWKNVVARFRKVFGGTVLVLYVTHRLHATPPMMRNAGTWVFTGVEANDIEDMLEVIGKNKTNREVVNDLQQFLGDIITEGRKRGVVEFEYQDKFYRYKWGNKEDKGDGRLMVAIHEHHVEIFNVQATEPDLDLESFRILPK